MQKATVWRLAGKVPARWGVWMRAGVSGVAMGGLAACAGQPQFAQAPDIQQQRQEAASYLAHAKPRYQPPGPPQDPWGPYIAEASGRFDVPGEWIRQVMKVESAGYQFRATGELTTSPVGAMGLMQLMPETYDEMRGRYRLGADAYEPHDNILAGAAYLREMYDAFGAPAFLAAYNAGPNRLQEYLVHNKPLPDETRRYVRLIGHEIEGTWPHNRAAAELLAVNQIPIDIPAGPRWVVHHARTRLAGRGHNRHDTATRYATLHRKLRGHASAPVEVAEAPDPRPAQWTTASRSLVHHAGAFSLITPALASERPIGGGANWGVQVGAYASRAQAVHAADSAQGLVSHASLAVASGHSGHAVVYRARLGGMTHDAAVAACHRLAHRGGCLLVSPAER